MLDFRTPNALWASVLVETLVRLGLQTAVISPGSRSTPLTLALAQHPAIDALPILDERSASFFALGRSRHSGRAVVLVCTSGTAGANYLPAVIEARESQVPLLILTADRPPELRDCASGQTIDQQKLFGTFPNYYGELALPEASEPMLRYLRQAIAVHPLSRPETLRERLRCSFGAATRTGQASTQALRAGYANANTPIHPSPTGRLRHTHPTSLHRRVIWPGSIEDLARALLSSELPPVSIQAKTYRHQWQTLNQQAQTRLDQAMAATEDLFEGKLAWLLPQVLPPDTAVFIANSTPVRDVEWFWPGNDRHLRPHFSRGANGIDGTLSTALGMAHGRDRNVLITGDLALLHDSNGLLLRPHFRGHLTILLLNNQGGGIFEMLPVADLDPPFEQFFATPQAVDFAPLCAAHGVAYEAIHTWPTLVKRLESLPSQGIRLLELRSDRKRDAQRRQQWLMALAQPSA
jgi:2-succinyl-5-enolpyruvyl-6-hydroxy-3-cyclohexene-1-carboxylate synthase